MAYPSEQPNRSLFIESKIPNVKEVTNHYSLIPNNKQNNVDLKIQGHPTVNI